MNAPTFSRAELSELAAKQIATLVLDREWSSDTLQALGDGLGAAGYSTARLDRTLTVCKIYGLNPVDYGYDPESWDPEDLDGAEERAEAAAAASRIAVDEIREAEARVDRARDGDSNDEEIEAQQHLIELLAAAAGYELTLS